MIGTCFERFFNISRPLCGLKFRTKRWMHSPKFSERLLYYPQLAASELLPSGVPAGWAWRNKTGTLSSIKYFPTTRFSNSVHNKSRRCCLLFFTYGPAVISEKNEIKAAYKDHVLKHVGLLRNPLFGLSRGADYLEEWVEGLLAPCPLLDVSGFPG